MASNRPNTRDELIDYCLRRLGAPVIEINVALDQVEDRVDDAFDFYQEFHSDATHRTYLKHLVTSTDVTNKYIPIPSSVIYVTKLFPVITAGNSSNFFDIKYQMMLNDVADMGSFIGDLMYYEQMQQHLALIDTKLNGVPQVGYSRRENKLNIHGEWQNGDIKAGDYLVVEALQIVNPDTNTSIYDDRFLKDYTTALIKIQWGSNLIKFEGMVLPGGATLNGRQIYDDALLERDRLEERMRLEQEMPPDFMVG
mgnify:FL=1